MEEKNSFFNKLKRLFSGEVIVRHVGKKQLKVIDTGTKQFAHSVDRFNRLRKRDTINLGAVNQYSYSDTRIELFRDYECLAGETKIPLPDGTSKTLEELSKLYPNKEDKFYVFSYDYLTDSIKLGEAHSVRKTKTDMTYKIKFDNGRELIATANHPFLMRTGKYKRVDELEVGESVMPGYMKDIRDFSTSIQHSINRIIVSIEKYQVLDVYDMTVEEYHNFSTEICFVHNSMDRDPIISSALDLYAEESTTKNEYGDVLNIITDNQDIKEILENLYYDILNIEFTLPSWVRNLVKYGDFFLYLDIHDEYGVTNIIPISVYDIKRLEGDNPNDPYELKFIIGEQVREPAENFQVAHFRLLSDANFLPYGRSAIEGARKVWKKLHLMEDAMLIHRITRAPERRIYKIDVGNLPPNEVDNYMNNIIQSTKKIPFMDPTTGDYNLKFNLMNVMEDYFIPTRGGTAGTDIDIAPALNYDAIEDIEYLRNKMMAALRIPKAFLGYEEGIGAKCLHPNTKISLLDGTVKTIKEISELFEQDSNIDLWTYTFDFKSNSVVPSKIKLAEQTRKNAQLVRVHIDNDTYIDCTPDHKFILKGGKEVQAKDLNPNDSLQIINKRNKGLVQAHNKYEQIYQPSLKNWQWTHKMVDEYINGKIYKNGWNGKKFNRESLIVVHHDDFDRLNNSPSNLKRMELSEHRKIHSEHCDKIPGWNFNKKWQWLLNKLSKNRKRSSKRQKDRMEKDPSLKNILRDIWLAKSPEEKSRITKKGWANHPENIKERIKLNKELNLAKKMRAGLKKKYPNGRTDLQNENSVNWIERPGFEELVDFIINNKNNYDLSTITKFAKAFGKAKYIIQETIEEAGYSCTEFMNYYWGFTRGRPNNIKLDDFIELSSRYKDEHDFYNQVNISRKGLKSILNNHNLTEQTWKTQYLGTNYNHKVQSVEWLIEKIDTYNMEVDNENHNFLLDNGIVIKNSTLAAEDLRFARTIERVQRIIISELYKVGIVHLYAQGYRNEDLVDFKLELTSPSVVYEEEKIALWDAKISLAANIRDVNLLSTDWIYTELFKLSKEDADNERENLLNDAFFEYRLSKILDEGEDPIPRYDNKIGSEGAEKINYDDESEVEDEEDNNEADNTPRGSTEVGNQAEFNDSEIQSNSPLETGQSAPSTGAVEGGGQIMAGESVDRSKRKKNKSKKKDDDKLGLKDLKKSLSVSKSDIKHRYKGGSPLSIKDYKLLDKWLMKHSSGQNKDILNG